MRLIDQDGAHLDANDWSERILVLNFMFTSCPSACPRLTQSMRQTWDFLPEQTRDDVRFLSISVDPDRDQPTALKEFARKHRADLPEWRFARIDGAELSSLTQRLAVFEPGSRAVPSAHSMAVYVFDRKGRPRQRYDGGTIDPRHLAREIGSLATLEQSSKS